MTQLTALPLSLVLGCRLPPSTCYARLMSARCLLLLAPGGGTATLKPRRLGAADAASTHAGTGGALPSAVRAHGQLSSGAIEGKIIFLKGVQAPAGHKTVHPLIICAFSISSVVSPPLPLSFATGAVCFVSVLQRSTYVIRVHAELSVGSVTASGCNAPAPVMLMI